MFDWSNMKPPEQPPQWPAPVVATPQPITATIDAVTLESMRDTLTNELLPVSADGILMLWQRLKERLTAAKEAEMNFRKVAVKVFVPTPKEGMNTVDLGNGYQLKAGINFSYTLDSDVDKVSEVQSAIAGIGNYGAIVAVNLFKWSCDLVLSQYRVLEQDAATYPEVAEMKKLVDRVLTKTDKAPLLELKEPKKKK
jgi:hypothetical protein